ncbi:MAG: NnrU family protein [Paracoccus sp. (in: a-proteobacteria)]|nr:NnrU family protein [Paracoccus sp. (in: a-proteobacteria)]
MGGWSEMACAFALFLAAHVIPAMPRLRGPLIGALGRAGYLAGFSLVSLGLLYWLLMAAGRAPYVGLWPPAIWQRWVVNLAMPAAILLTVFGTAAPNPFGVGGQERGFDPDRPGIVGVTRHPLMWAFALWAGAHLLANGDLAHAILFGAMLIFALSGIAAAEARARRQPGFAMAARRSSLIPLAALITGRWRPAALPSGRRMAIAVAVWLGLLALHPSLIGVSPLP